MGDNEEIVGKYIGKLGSLYANQNQLVVWILTIFASLVKLCWPNECGAFFITLSHYSAGSSRPNISPMVQFLMPKPSRVFMRGSVSYRLEGSSLWVQGEELMKEIIFGYLKIVVI